MKNKEQNSIDSARINEHSSSGADSGQTVREDEAPEHLSKYVYFILAGQTEKTKVYDVLTKGDHIHLGNIKWFGRWRKYAFFPAKETVFETVCLTDITNFISELMQERKNGQHCKDCYCKLGECDCVCCDLNIPCIASRPIKGLDD